ncbi:MAG: AtpZ/AtpI family protein [Alphaproteobacteria bacterium]|nr:AtpZ/AtpI family protein [Alphaproteobacteria bacterium]
MDERAKPPKLDKAGLEELDARLRAARERSSQPARDAAQPGGGGAGVRIGLEMVVGVAVGAGLGVMLDRWLGTQPWFLLGLFVLGAAAGFRNVMLFVERQSRESKAAAKKTDGAPPP